ncbi:MAG: HEAT repeat domain-containing protein [Longimicrobiales bacterium]|nr:HEAT repeat domain-containing protein [Longimicrobiales bacterium]
MTTRSLWTGAWTGAVVALGSISNAGAQEVPPPPGAVGAPATIRSPAAPVAPPDRAIEGVASRTAPPAALLQEDPGAQLYQEAREALARGRYEAAAGRFEELRSRHPRSAFVADSYYWQAFALYREDGTRELRRAAELLSRQAESHAEARTREDAEALRVRIEARLAQRGDAEAAEAITRQAVGPCDEGQEVRLAALSALLNMNAQQATPILRDVLRRRDECSVELRRRAVFLVAQTLDEESVDVLVDLAHRNPDPDPEVREQAVFWLHQVQTPEALAALESILLESQDPEIQERAIFAIGQRGEGGIDALRRYVEREDVPAELRADAIFWMGQSGDADGTEYIIDLYPSLEDPELKERALFAIAQSGSDEAFPWLTERMRDPSETLEARKQALFWAGQMGAVSMTDLRQLYAGLDDPEMKEQLIFVAAQQGDDEAVDFLMEVAAEDEDPEMRERAIFWLGQSDDPRVTEFLLGLVRG